jgi:hypothetical protein
VVATRHCAFEDVGGLARCGKRHFEGHSIQSKTRKNTADLARQAWDRHNESALFRTGWEQMPKSRTPFVGGAAGNQPHIGCSIQYNSLHLDPQSGVTYFAYWYEKRSLFIHSSWRFVPSLSGQTVVSIQNSRYRRLYMRYCFKHVAFCFAGTFRLTQRINQALGSLGTNTPSSGAKTYMPSLRQFQSHILVVSLSWQIHHFQLTNRKQTICKTGFWFCCRGAGELPIVWNGPPQSPAPPPVPAPDCRTKASCKKTCAGFVECPSDGRYYCCAYSGKHTKQYLPVICMFLAEPASCRLDP